MQIREAVAGDSEQACNVMRRSITELCAADHGNDFAILARWLANKTPENVAVWIARPDSSLLLAVEGGAIVAVGMVTDAGEICSTTSRPTRGFAASAERSSPRSNPGRRSAAPGSAVSRARKRRIASTAAPAMSRRIAERKIRHGVGLPDDEGFGKVEVLIAGERCRLLASPPRSSPASSDRAPSALDNSQE